MKNKNVALLFLSLAVLFVGIWTYTKAEVGEITACVKKDGSLYVLAQGNSCKGQDNLLTWNIIGPQGPKGDKGDIGEQGLQGPQGEPGLPAQNGSGNIAFTIQADEVLKTDGTVWMYSNGSWIQNPDISPIPVPVSNIVDFVSHGFLDKDGNYWRYSGSVWVNIGHP